VFRALSQGIDAGKKIVGRKRSIVTDTMGLLLAVLVTAASVQDSVAGTQVLDQVAAKHPRVRKVWVDGGYRQHVAQHAATLGIDMEITARTPRDKTLGETASDHGMRGRNPDVHRDLPRPAPLPRRRSPRHRTPRRS
jgi:hypothetical protein